MSATRLARAKAQLYVCFSLIPCTNIFGSTRREDMKLELVGGRTLELTVEQGQPIGEGGQQQQANLPQSYRYSKRSVLLPQVSYFGRHIHSLLAYTKLCAVPPVHPST
jgi:hypothetical protein